jgi:hypothetical protein
MSTSKNSKNSFLKDNNADPSKADSGGIIALFTVIAVAIGMMIFSSYAPSLRELTILLVALIFLAMGIWYLIYSVQLYRKSVTPDNSIVAKAYDRLLSAIGN